ncbi:hypothetical protein BGX34_010415 [Mortierella sp. NVP85]|nr:hypothetical protein BGX34_010415 [Mortierella sp. NVP85]
MQPFYYSPPPPRNSLQIVISGIPAENGKCRVETQLKIGFHLRKTNGEAVLDWKQLRLPRMMIAKEKHRIEKFNGRDKHLQDSDILTLEARLVCDHDRNKVLECCDNCIGRERKRAHRRKETHQKLPGPLASIPVFGAINPKIAGTLTDTESDPPTPTDPIKYQAWERSRIMVFSSTEYVDISTGECVLPTRITCYCRHHNEKVGFRIQFTARNSTGMVVASVLTNPVMMMDDHKSGKRTAPNDAKTAGQTSRRSVPTSSRRQKQQPLQPVRVADRMPEERGDYDEEDQDDVDLEAGDFIPTYRMIPLKVEDDDDDDNGYDDNENGDEDETQSSPMHVLSPLGPTGRATKRRVDEDDDQMTDDIQVQQFYRRKTSHDGHDMTQPFMTPSTFSSPSPFMPGSPFAKEDEQHHNIFAPSFSQAMAHNGNVLGDQEEKFQVDSASIMMESFTTFDEPVSSSLNDLQSCASSVYSFGAPSPPSTTASTPVFTAQRGSFSSMLYSPVSPFTPSIPPALPLNWPGANVPPVSSASGLNPSFLDTTQMHEFQSFQRQNNMAAQQLLQQQQLLMLQLQRHQQQQQQRFPTDTKPWAPTPPTEKKDPLQSLKAVLAQTINPTSASYIPTSLPDNIGSEYSNATSPSGSSMPSPLLLPMSVPMSMSMSTPSLATTMDSDMSAQHSKKRGRPRKGFHGRLPPLTKITTNTQSSSSSSSSSTTNTTAATTPASGASSPMLSPKAPSTNMPSSPSPPPYMGYPSTVTTPILAAENPFSPTSASSTSATAAAQFMFYQQQQLQLQQKHALFATAPSNRVGPCHSVSPRIQKVIPAKGSMEGGAEVTLLGRGFFPGMVPTFDGVPALNVQFFGPDTIICRLPPRASPGVVLVKAHSQQQQQQLQGTTTSAGPGSMAMTVPSSTSSSNGDSEDGDEDEEVGVVFEYEEDKGDRDLIALALQVLGMKMNGRVEAPNQIAMRIMAKAAEQQQQQDMFLQQQRNAIMAAAGAAIPATSTPAVSTGSSSKALTTVPKTKSSSTPKSLHGLLPSQQQQQQQQQPQPALIPIALQSPGSFLQFNSNQSFAQHR